MNTKPEIQKLINYIEENTRASQVSGISFIDPKNHKGKILLKQNHVVFGRRGAGKTSLINTLCDVHKINNHIITYTNLEDYKDVSFPNILLHVLQAFFKQIKRHLKTRLRQNPISYPKYLRILRKINRNLKEIENSIITPDKLEEKIKEKGSADAKVDFKFGASSSTAKVGIGDSSSVEIEKTLIRDKLDTLKNSIPNLKEILTLIASFIDKKPIFIILDDFYFVPKNVQPYFIDFFHRLSKDTMLYLKLATIKHRSKLYLQLSDSYIGTELGHDIHEIDLDYTLDKFEELKNFMHSLVQEACKEINIQVDLDPIFSEAGLSQLCLASGGVPRDYLILLKKLLEKYQLDVKKISKQDVIETAIENMVNKISSLKTDSATEKDILEYYLHAIQDYIIKDKSTNIFLVNNRDLDSFPQIRQAINELLDLRMFHLVESNISAAPSDGKMYMAFMIDIGLYTNAKPRDFNQVEPDVTDTKGRKDQIRSSPRLTNAVLEKIYAGDNYIDALTLTD